MKLWNNLVNKEEVYSAISFLSNLNIAVAIFFIAAYLVVPLLGGTLSIITILSWVSFLGIALTMKFVSRRVQKEMGIRAYDYVLVYVAIIVNLLVWFSFPLNIVLSLLISILCAFAYRHVARSI